MKERSSLQYSVFLFYFLIPLYSKQLSRVIRVVHRISMVCIRSTHLVAHIRYSDQNRRIFDIVVGIYY